MTDDVKLLRISEGGGYEEDREFSRPWTLPPTEEPSEHPDYRVNNGTPEVLVGDEWMPVIDYLHSSPGWSRSRASWRRMWRNVRDGKPMRKRKKEHLNLAEGKNWWKRTPAEDAQFRAERLDAKP